MRLSRRDTSSPRDEERPGNGVVPPPADAPPAAEDPSAEAIPPVRDMEGGPDSPLEIGKTGWLNTLKRAFKKFSKDRCSMAAGSLAYHWFLALFPALIALLAVVSLVHLDATQVNNLVNGMGKAIPGTQSVFSTATKSATSHTSGSLATVILGILVAVWSASGGMVALETALDVAYEVPTNAKFAKKRMKALILMVCTVVFGGIASIFIIEGGPLGTGIESHMPVHGTAFLVVWNVVRWVVTVILVSLLFSCYYYFGPNRETPKWQWVSPGGVIGTIIFLAASLGFSFYVAKLGNASYTKTYGALAGVVLLMFWLYLTGIAILLGGEINAETEREAAAQAGHPGAQASAQTVEEGSASASSNRASS